MWQHQKPLVIADQRKEKRFAPVLDKLRERGIRTYCMLPLTTSQARLGGLGFGTSHVAAYSEKDLEFLVRVAELVALALENVLTREALAHETERLRMLVEVNRTLVSRLDLQKLISSITSNVGRVVPHEFAGVALYNDETQAMQAWVPASPQNRTIITPGHAVPREQSPAWQALHRRRLAGKIW